MFIVIVYPVLCTADLAEVVETCSTYIVIQIIPINEAYCGGAVTYTTTVSPSHGQIAIMNETIHNITGLTNNTSYMIAVDAWRGDSKVHQTRISRSTLQPLSKYVCVMHHACMYHLTYY